MNFSKTIKRRRKLSKKEILFHNKVSLFIKDPLPKDIELDAAIEYLENIIPYNIAVLVDCIYIGEFDFLSKDNITALYKDGALFISNNQNSKFELISDIVHEYAHVIEKRFTQDIYTDEILDEFLRKRIKLYHILINDYDFNKEAFVKIKYDRDFDEFLYKTVGYSKLDVYSNHFFIEPYAITSIREYWATGFEHFLLFDPDELKEVSPNLYNKIKYIMELSQGGY